MSQKLLDSSFLSAIKTPSFFANKQQFRILIFQSIGVILLYMGSTCTVYKNPIENKQPHTKMMHDVYISMSLYLVLCLFNVLGVDGGFNPAVTLGAWVAGGNKKDTTTNNNIVISNKKGLTKRKLLLYWSAQLIGTIISCIICKIIYDCGQGFFKNTISYSFKDILLYSIEQMIGTLFFVLFILIITTKETTFIHEQCWVHLFIPICLYGGRKLSKNIGALHPFFLIAGQILTLFDSNFENIQNLFYTLIICGAELLGACMAALFFKYFFYKQLNKWRNQL